MKMASGPFTVLPIPMPENQPVEWKADWEALYGTLEPGQYRLVKPVMDFRGPGDFTEYGLTAEFELPGPGVTGAAGPEAPGFSFLHPGGASAGAGKLYMAL